MVDGCRKIEAHAGGSGHGLHPCIVVDLDGTLLRGNSLHLMLRFLVRKLRREGDVLRLARLCALLGLRRLRLISHVRMKRPLHALGAGVLTESDIAELTTVLRERLNRELLQELTAYRKQSYRMILATAAPDFYLAPIAAELGFDAVIGTPLSATVGTYLETRGERKRDLCLERAAGEGWKIRAVATDHPDDLPLLQLPDITRLLVDPSSSLSSILRRLSLPYREIR